MAKNRTTSQHIDRAKALLRPNIAKMEGYQPGEQPAPGAKVIKLNTNENPYPPSPQVVAALQKFLSDGGDRLRLYPNRFAQSLRAKAAQIFNLPEDYILCGNGSDELLTMITRAYVGPRQRGEIVYPYPSYILYETLAEIEDAKSKTLDFPPDFSIPEGLAVTSARVLFLANPNSPSGTITSLEKVRALAQTFQGLVVIDEAYADFADFNCLSLVRELDNVVVLRSFSKSYSLAGMRLGLAFAQPEIIASLMKVKESYNVDALAAVAGVAALDDQAHLAKNVAAVRATRTKLTEDLRKLGWEVLPSQANFVYARVRWNGPTAEATYMALKQHDILVRYFPHRLLEDGLRISVGNDMEIAALVNVLERLAKTGSRIGVQGLQVAPSHASDTNAAR
ncbi:MAG: histidinol-phosphate transaminase [Planctomycetota bacterium]